MVLGVILSLFLSPLLPQVHIVYVKKWKNKYHKMSKKKNENKFHELQFFYSLLLLRLHKECSFIDKMRKIYLWCCNKRLKGKWENRCGGEVEKTLCISAVQGINYWVSAEY